MTQFNIQSFHKFESLLKSILALSLLIGFAIAPDAKSDSVISNEMIFGNEPSESASPQDQTDWEKLIQKIVSEGVFYQTVYGNFMVFEKTTPENKELDHRSNYISAMGGFAEPNVFFVNQIESVLEIWTTNPDGNWEIQQWGFSLTPEGNIIKFSRTRMVQSKDSRVLEYESPAFSKAEAEAKWAEIKEEWLNLVKSEAAGK